MAEVMAERRGAHRYPKVLAAEVVEVSSGAKYQARTSDISQTGCYIDTLNPMPMGSALKLRITHGEEVFEALGTVVYVSRALGMGIFFSEMAALQRGKLDSWLNETGREF